MEALGYIANLLRQSRMREALYHERYEVANNYQNGLVSHIEYRESLKELYSSILLFEATSVCYLSRNTASRIALDAIKWNNWKTLLASIKSQEEMFSSVNELWKETKYQEECKAANLRHLQQLESIDAVGDEVSDSLGSLIRCSLTVSACCCLNGYRQLIPQRNIRLQEQRMHLGLVTGLFMSPSNFNVGKVPRTPFSGSMAKGASLLFCTLSPAET